MNEPNYKLMPEPLARAILRAAINEGRAAELLDCLFDGGSATVDAVTGQLVLASSDILKKLAW